MWFASDFMCIFVCFFTLRLSKFSVDAIWICQNRFGLAVWTKSSGQTSWHKRSNGRTLTAEFCWWWDWNTSTLLRLQITLRMYLIFLFFTESKHEQWVNCSSEIPLHWPMVQWPFTVNLFPLLLWLSCWAGRSRLLGLAQLADLLKKIHPGGVRSAPSLIIRKCHFVVCDEEKKYF